MSPEGQHTTTVATGWGTYELRVRTRRGFQAICELGHQSLFKLHEFDIHTLKK